MREYNAKVDANQPEIVSELRAAGFLVIDAHSSLPFDLVVIGFGSPPWQDVTRVCLVEVKSPGGRLTAREAKFRDELQASGRDGVYLIATSAADVLRWFGR